MSAKTPFGVVCRTCGMKSKSGGRGAAPGGGRQGPRGVALQADSTYALLAADILPKGERRRRPRVARAFRGTRLRAETGFMVPLRARGLVLRRPRLLPSGSPRLWDAA